MVPEVNGWIEQLEGRFVLRDAVQCAGKSELLDVFWQRMMQQDFLPKVQVFYEADSVAPGEASTLSLKTEAMPGEAYRLEISTDAICVYAEGDAGHIWGLTTLFHLLREGEGSCSCQRISDAPLYRHRGFHMDCSRHFFTVETVLLMIEKASLCKMNRMHWHFSDDQGYRLESRRFPKLNTIGSKRKEADGSLYEGFYTVEEIQQIVQYAKLRGVEILPEIDIPGHVNAMLASYPQLSCSGEAMEIPSEGCISERVLCVGQDATVSFVKELLDEVAAFFPYPCFHIGGDEVPKSEWKKCPHCQAKMQRLGLVSEEDLQAHFTMEVTEHLRGLKKTAVCWNDALKASELPKDICVQYWDEEDGDYCSKDPHFMEREWIYSYRPNFYFDFPIEETPMEKVLAYEPVTKYKKPLPTETLLGIECELWAEHIYTQEDLLRHAFPRMYAVAHLAWKGKKEPA